MDSLTLITVVTHVPTISEEIFRKLSIEDAVALLMATNFLECLVRSFLILYPLVKIGPKRFGASLPLYLQKIYLQDLEPELAMDLIVRSNDIRLAQEYGLQDKNIISDIYEYVYKITSLGMLEAIINLHILFGIPIDWTSLMPNLEHLIKISMSPPSLSYRIYNYSKFGNLVRYVNKKDNYFLSKLLIQAISYVHEKDQCWCYTLYLKICIETKTTPINTSWITRVDGHNLKYRKLVQKCFEPEIIWKECAAVRNFSLLLCDRPRSKDIKFPWVVNPLPSDTEDGKNVLAIWEDHEKGQKYDSLTGQVSLAGSNFYHFFDNHEKIFMWLLQLPRPNKAIGKILLQNKNDEIQTMPNKFWFYFIMYSKCDLLELQRFVQLYEPLKKIISRWKIFQRCLCLSIIPRIPAENYIYIIQYIPLTDPFVLLEVIDMMTNNNALFDCNESLEFYFMTVLEAIRKTFTQYRSSILNWAWNPRFIKIIHHEFNMICSMQFMGISSVEEIINYLKVHYKEGGPAQIEKILRINTCSILHMVYSERFEKMYAVFRFLDQIKIKYDHDMVISQILGTERQSLKVYPNLLCQVQDDLIKTADFQKNKLRTFLFDRLVSTYHCKQLN
uniref:Uncharacterized protein n=1 Tax=Abalone asfa-like virus TaxID=2839893 RepID=A0A5K7Y7P8_9VIRU|nr:hypothetical protein [Abalone asfa-like virus]BCY04515.1 hypothetical protein [Abalone asfa-like virus]